MRCAVRFSPRYSDIGEEEEEEDGDDKQIRRIKSGV
jgi:hypothetical protein